MQSKSIPMLSIVSYQQAATAAALRMDEVKASIDASQPAATPRKRRTMALRAMANIQLGEAAKRTRAKAIKPVSEPRPAITIPHFCTVLAPGFAWPGQPDMEPQSGGMNAANQCDADAVR